MSLDYTRITTGAKEALEAHGLKPDLVPLIVEGFPETGKGVLELIIDEIAKAVVNEIVSNAVIKSVLDVSLNTVFTGGVPVPTDGGLALQTAWKLSTAAGIADKATGGIT